MRQTAVKKSKNRAGLVKCWALLFILGAVVQARRERFEITQKVSAGDFAIPSASPVAVAVFIAIISAMALVIIWLFIRQEREKHKKITAYAERAFQSSAEKYGLNTGEVAELRRIAAGAVSKDYNAVFTSLEVFETAVDQECTRIRKKWGLNAKAENATMLIHTIRTKLGNDNIPFEQPIVSTRNVNRGQFIAVSDPDRGFDIVEQAVFSGGNELTFSLYYKPGTERKSAQGVKNMQIDFTRNGDGSYTATVPVVSVHPSDGHIVLEHTASLERNQLRKHLRMIVDIEFKCRVIRRSVKERPPFVGKLLENTRIVDISGGGAAFLSTQSLDPGDLISLMFKMGGRKFALKGRVIAVGEQEGKVVVNYKHRVAFTDVDNSDVDFIVKYIFQKQREQVQFISGRRR
ncbi:MAG: flagellar brake protein [Fibrobacterota bacterium]